MTSSPCAFRASILVSLVFCSRTNKNVSLGELIRSDFALFQDPYLVCFQCLSHVYFYLFWYFDMFCENCAYVSQKDRKKSKMEFWRVQRQPVVRCMCRIDRWTIAPLRLKRSAPESCAEKSEDGQRPLCSDRSRRSRSHWTNLQRPLQDVQRPLPKSTEASQFLSKNT